jgi:hypothetical protein
MLLKAFTRDNRFSVVTSNKEGHTYIICFANSDFLKD